MNLGALWTTIRDFLREGVWTLEPPPRSWAGRARRFAERGHEVLRTLPDNGARRSLSALANSIVGRAS